MHQLSLWGRAELHWSRCHRCDRAALHRQRTGCVRAGLLRARYLSSSFGRFTTPDWASAPTSVPYAQFGDPQSLNLYVYVGNNPNTGIDADGHVTDPTQAAANAVTDNAVGQAWDQEMQGAESSGGAYAGSSGSSSLAAAEAGAGDNLGGSVSYGLGTGLLGASTQGNTLIHTATTIDVTAYLSYQEILNWMPAVNRNDPRKTPDPFNAWMYQHVTIPSAKLLDENNSFCQGANNYAKKDASISTKDELLLQQP